MICPASIDLTHPCHILTIMFAFSSSEAHGIRSREADFTCHS